MKSKKLLFLVIVAVVLCGLAYLTSVRRRPGGTSVSSMMGKPVLTALQDTDSLNSVAKIVIVSPSSTITVARVDNVWVAPSRYDYPVDFEKLRSFLRKLRELTIGHMLTGAEDQLSELELQTPDADAAPQSAGTKVELYNGDGALVTSMVVGKEHRKSMPANTPPSPFGGMGGYPDGRYVRVEDRAFLISDPLQDLPKQPQDWMSTQLANLASRDIEQIMISEGDQSLVLKRPDGGGDLTLPELAENEEMDTSKVNSLANTLSYLSFSDLAAPALSDEEMGFDDPVIYSARNKANQIYTLKLGGSPEGSDNRYVRLSASYTAPKDVETPSADEEVSSPAAAADPSTEAAAQDASAEQQKVAARKAEQAERAKEIETFNATVQGWTYILPSHKLTSITVDRSALVKEKKDEAEQDADAAD